MTQPSDIKVALVGTGVMGASMAGHLLAAGHPLTVYNRTRSRAQPLLDRGAVWADSPGDAAASADVVITMVGYPSDVEDVYFGHGGIIAQAPDAAVLVDMTTSSPLLAEKVAAAAHARGIAALDAPVSGGDIGARNATLTIMVGGDSAAFDAVQPVLSVLGTNVVLQGGPGAGQHTKMANQVAIAGSMLAVVESMAYAAHAGLDTRRVLLSIGAGSAASWSLANLAPRILDGDFAPGFYVKHFVKDMRIALESAAMMGVTLPGLATAKRLYDVLEQGGGANLGTQALWLLYADDAARSREGVRQDATASSVMDA